MRLNQVAAPKPDITHLLASPRTTAELMIPEAADECVNSVTEQARALVESAYKSGMLKEPLDLWAVLHDIHEAPQKMTEKWGATGPVTVPAERRRIMWRQVVVCLKKAKETKDRFNDVVQDKWASVRETDRALDLLAGSVGKEAAGPPEDLAATNAPLTTPVVESPEQPAPPASPVSPVAPLVSVDLPPVDTDTYKPIEWFREKTKIAPSRLRQATRANRKKKRVKTDKRDGVVRYSVQDVQQWWPHDWNEPM